MDAAEAHHRGLINEIVPANQLMTRARELAKMLSEGPPLVFAAIKEALRETETRSVQEAFDILNAQALPTVKTLYNSEDMHEGALAFKEKRDPIWKGR
jgi:crotonobetainyl-CoA hydratase